MMINMGTVLALDLQFCKLSKLSGTLDFIFQERLSEQHYHQKNVVITLH